jgi:surface carbohydrate biosynthesis protein
MKLDGDLPTVLFSIEIGARELDSKLVLASALAGKGCRTIVGHKEALKAVARSSKHVVWQGKSLFSGRGHEYIADRLLGNGSAIMFIHDEGAMHQVNAWTQNILKNHHVDDIRKRNISRVCVWGQRQKKVLSSYASELADTIRVTGSPRFDLCLPSYAWLTQRESDDARAKYSPYILACSRFVNAAHAEGQGDPFQRRMNPGIWPDNFDLKSIADIVFSQWQRAVHDFADFVMLIKELAVRYPKHTIVLRPHPSESLDFYRLAFGYFKNVAVTNQGSVLNWIRSAELMVHSNCTTGIEAILAGRPALNLLPASPGREHTDVEIAREAGVSASSVEEALDKIEALLAGDSPPHAWSSHAQSMLHNLSGESIPLLVEETMNVLKQERIDSSEVTLPEESQLRSMVRRFIKKTPANSHIASKRGGSLNADHIEWVIDGARQAHGGGGRIGHMTERYVVLDPA